MMEAENYGIDKIWIEAVNEKMIIQKIVEVKTLVVKYRKTVIEIWICSNQRCSRKKTWGYILLTENIRKGV